MSEENKSGLPFAGESEEEQALWDALEDLPRDEPSPRLRQSFYEELARASRPSWAERLRDLLGFSGNAGWVTAMASVLLGVALAQAIAAADPDNPARQRDVAISHTTLGDVYQAQGDLEAALAAQQAALAIFQTLSAAGTDSAQWPGESVVARE